MSDRGWPDALLGDLLAERPKNGYSPSAADDWTGTLMLGLGCLTEGGFQPIQLKSAPVDDPRVQEALLEEGDLLISRSNTRDRVGLAGRYVSVGTPCIYPDLMMRLRPGLRVTPSHLERVLQSPIVRRQVEAAAVGTSGSMVKINRAAVEALRIPLPPLAEQHRVARILDTIDEAIRKTEQVIAKLQQMKQGLLHDLLNRGIDENGELRDPERQPELFKDSSFGQLPVAWRCRELGDHTTWLSGGTPAKSISSFWSGSIPWVSPKDMKVFRLETASNKVTDAAVVAGSRLAPEGSVLVVVRGMILAHTFPVCLTTKPVAFNQDVKAVIPGPELDEAYLAHWFVGNSHRMLGLVTEATHGTKRIDLDDLVRYPLLLPPVAEQRHVAQLLDRTDARIAQEMASTAKLRALKAGLMDDLLSGRVRVPVLQEVPS